MKNFKSPGLEELYSEGPHLAAYSYEVGNAELDNESGYGVDLYTSWHSKEIHIEFTGYRNHINHFIFPRNTGKMNLNTTLPEYQFTGTEALFYGFEGHTEINLPYSLSLNGTVSYVRAEFVNKEPVPFIPPFSTKWHLKYSQKKLTVSVSARYSDDQNRLGEFEEPTKSYFLLGSGVEYHFSTQSGLHIISLSIDNLLNSSYRNHLSRVKSIMPEPGRNIRMVYKLIF